MQTETAREVLSLTSCNKISRMFFLFQKWKSLRNWKKNSAISQIWWIWLKLYAIIITSLTFFDVTSHMVICGHSWSLVVTRGHSWVLLDPIQILTFVTQNFIGSYVIRCTFWLVSKKNDCVERVLRKSFGSRSLSTKLPFICRINFEKYFLKAIENFFPVFA